MSIREAIADWMDISFYPLATLPLQLRPPPSHIQAHPINPGDNSLVL